MRRSAGRLVVVVLSMLSAGFHCGEMAQVKLGAPFELRVGEKASVEGGELVVTFLGVTEDSRCPKGEQCIQAGRARLSLEAAPRGGEATRFELDTSLDDAEAVVSGFRVALGGLAPHRVSGRPISPQDYLCNLTINRL